MYSSYGHKGGIILSSFFAFFTNTNEPHTLLIAITQLDPRLMCDYTERTRGKVNLIAKHKSEPGNQRLGGRLLVLLYILKS